MNNRNTLERNLKYATSLYGDDVEVKNISGKDTLVPIYDEVLQININNFTFECLDENMTVSVTRNDNYKRTSLIIIDVYLPNIVRKYRKHGKENLTEQERTILAMFISNKKDAIELSEGDDVLMAYVKELKKLKDEKGREYELNEYFEYDQIELGRAYGKEEGRKEGRNEGLKEGQEQGRKENSKEIATNMLKKGMDTKTVHECTNLPLYDIEAIQSTIKPMIVAEESQIFEYGNPVNK